ncbi:fructose-specific PTS transporter subunit EIIC [Paraconexibacter antarcticus]|uniref:Fructose-specific PTS transporter subunit EIIC n=1 Tax=Paraconexibacter antarcticus TaxID=2949664 RepID=A0ABY5DZT9_9ACTN|nr:fructose-specific PTS transporter subunit EIIC [Paraconexibacter antarcticus]UTI66352.1 fructose-specific PTS transporter subunit EIIC [Paraconexibacter antarcticus]
MKLVAVTSCPTGIAHTYMAAEALSEAAKAAGHELEVETQGSAGLDRLDPATIAAADAVIFAADVEVRERDRFDGKPTVVAKVKDGINRPAELIERAVAAAAEAPAASTPAAAVPAAGVSPATKAEEGASWAGRLRGWLMTGVSYMIPFVAAGGILIALAFLIGGPEIASKVNGGTFDGHTYKGVSDLTLILNQFGVAGVMFKIGATSFSMLVPILAGFIAYAMADRPGLVPGVVAGLLASAVGAGFLGGLIGGLLAGAIVLQLVRLDVPRAIAGVMPVVIIPLVSTLVVGFVMLVVVGKPIASATNGMTGWLNGLGDSNKILLGLIVGAMMAFDLGGPVNKVAYTFGLASLSAGNLNIMAAVMAAGMTPPIALALATVVRPKLFNDAERKAGEAAWLLGASFITEGAIPFAAADPVRVIPSMMAGSAVTGALSMAFDATSRAPHGGIWVVGLIGHPLLYLVAILAGIGVSAASVVALKSRRILVPSGDAVAAAAPSSRGVVAA